jgi:hypothetical protein
MVKELLSWRESGGDALPDRLHELERFEQAFVAGP